MLIRDHHPGFVTWERYEDNLARLRSNWRAPRGHGGGAPREGTALLQGRIRCGRCGRMMQTGYSGANGNSPRYLCARAQQLYGGERGCQSLGGRRLEQRVLDEVFTVLAPAALAATAAALGEAQTRHAQRLAAFELAVERARYEAERARRQFDAVEPENRLVARTLEREWEQALHQVRRAEADLAAQQARRPVTLTAEELAWAEKAGADVRAVFDAPTTTTRERKQLLRAVIDEVVVTAHTAEGHAEARIIWQGGASTELTIPLSRSGGHCRTTDEDTVDLVRRLAAHYDDTTIALIPSRQQRRTATGLPFTKTRVKNLRQSREIPAYTGESVTPPSDDAVMVSVPQAAQQLQVSTDTIYRWLRDGFIAGEQLTPGAPWRTRIDQALRDRVVGQAPDGWLTLDETAKTLGVARQTVLHKVQRGELPAVHVNRGKRKGLRIQVKHNQPGLFDQP